MRRRRERRSVSTPADGDADARGLRSRRAGFAGMGLSLMLVAGACAGETGSIWTHAPLADAGDGTAQAEPEASPAPAADASPAPAAEASPDPTEVERDIPLQPPAGNTIPRFVEPERAEPLDAGDVDPAPIEIDPQALTSATSAPAATEPATMAPGRTAEPTATAAATGEPTTAPEASAAGAVTIELVAQETAFDADELTVSAGANVRLTLENLDPIPHNFAVYVTDAAEEPVFVGETFSGPDTSRTYEFTAPTEPGEFFFRCDIHPQLMTGTLIVE